MATVIPVFMWQIAREQEEWSQGLLVLIEGKEYKARPSMPKKISSVMTPAHSGRTLLFKQQSFHEKSKKYDLKFEYFAALKSVSSQ